MRDDTARLHDILDAIAQIEKYAVQGQEVFLQDELVQTWIVHHLQIIGEAARAISAALRTRYQQVAWSQIITMRNILVHEYFGVDLEEVWSTVEQDLPDLKHNIEAVLRDIETAF